MQFNFVSKDVALTPAMRKSVEEKLAKFDNYFSHECCDHYDSAESSQSCRGRDDKRFLRSPREDHK